MSNNADQTAPTNENGDAQLKIISRPPTPQQPTSASELVIDEIASSLNPYTSLIQKQVDSTSPDSKPPNVDLTITEQLPLSSITSITANDADSSQQRPHSITLASRGGRTRANSIKVFTEKAIHGVQRFSTDILRSIENAHELVDLKNSNFSSATQSAAAQLYTGSGSLNRSQRRRNNTINVKHRSTFINNDECVEEEPDGAAVLAESMGGESSSTPGGESVFNGSGGNRSKRCSVSVNNEERRPQQQNRAASMLNEGEVICLAASRGANELTDHTLNRRSSTVDTASSIRNVVCEPVDEKTNPNPLQFRTGSMFMIKKGNCVNNFFPHINFVNFLNLELRLVNLY
jgi:hypothetical protein